MSLNDPQWGRGGASGDAGDDKRPQRLPNGLLKGTLFFGEVTNDD